MSGKQPIPTSAVESVEAYLSEIDKFVRFVASTTTDESADAHLWCQYVGLALHEMGAASDHVTSHLIGYAVVSGTTPTMAASAADLSYYLARTALLDVPALRDRLPKLVKAEHINALQDEGLAEIGDFGPFAPETTYWQSWFEPSRHRARITSTLRGAVSEWLDTISRSSAAARAHARSESNDSDIWALRLLGPIGQIRATITTAANHSVRFAFDTGMVDSAISKAFHFGRRSLVGRIEGTRSLVVEDNAFADVAPPGTPGRIGPTVTISSTGDRIVVRSGPLTITEGATYNEALRNLFRRPSIEQNVRALLVIGGAVPPTASAALMDRYNLQRVDFAEEPIAEVA